MDDSPERHYSECRKVYPTWCPSERCSCGGKRTIFVFGSNLAGRHGKGAALYARQHYRAVYGQGIGLQGDAYAIPTKDIAIRTLPLPVIQGHVEAFLQFARKHVEMIFEVTAIGCGLAGYTPADIAPMFKEAPANVVLPEAFRQVLGREAN